MDKLQKQQKAILKVVQPFLKNKIANIIGGNYLYQDPSKNAFLIFTIGKDQDGVPIHDCFIHFEIKNGKIWLQKNYTDIDVAEELVEEGIPKKDIVVGFITPEANEYLGYAAA